MDRCDRCDGPIPNTRVSITLAAADKGELQATLCTIGCALDWLTVTPAKLKSMRAELAAKRTDQSEPDQHEALLAAFEAED